jgi:TRAP-type C4-dicarboxylate transport system permease large subunit
VVGVAQRTDRAAARKSRKEVIHSLVDGIWALILPGIIIFGLKFGIFTPTEAASCVRSLCAVRGDVHLPRAQVASALRVFVTAAKTTAIVMFLVAARWCRHG